MLFPLTILLLLPSFMRSDDDAQICKTSCDMPWCGTRPTKEPDICKVDIIRANYNNLVELIGKKYYFAREAFATPEEAVTLCKQLGMKLLSIESEIENQVIKDKLNEMEVGMEWFWSSGKRRGNTWLWTTTGQKVNYTDWLDSRPDPEATGDMCINISGQLHWWDDPCTYKWHFVCETN